MKLLQFIVVNEKLDDGHNVFTVTGECFMSCKKIYPVILQGKTCIGLGVVKSLLITEDSTRIEFDLSHDISKDAKRAYYDLYRNVVSVSNESDPYEGSEDAVIPGAAVGKKKSNRSGRRSYDDRESLANIAGIYDSDLGRYY